MRQNKTTIQSIDNSYKLVNIGRCDRVICFKTKAASRGQKKLFADVWCPGLSQLQNTGRSIRMLALILCRQEVDERRKGPK